MDDEVGASGGGTATRSDGRGVFAANQLRAAASTSPRCHTGSSSRGHRSVRGTWTHGHSACTQSMTSTRRRSLWHDGLHAPSGDRCEAQCSEQPPSMRTYSAAAATVRYGAISDGGSEAATLHSSLKRRRQRISHRIACVPTHASLQPSQALCSTATCSITNNAEIAKSQRVARGGAATLVDELGRPQKRICSRIYGTDT